MLVEEGFNMVSVDASDKMLKYALKARWDRRKESAFDQWGRKVWINSWLLSSAMFASVSVSSNAVFIVPSALYRPQSLKRPTG